MKVSGGAGEAALEYLFHLDAPIPRLIFGSGLTITGWLFHRTGEEIHGLRAILKPIGRGERIYKARRKHARPALGAAYPHLPEAAWSGFILEIDQLPFGRFLLRLEVRDQAKVWRPIFRLRTAGVPLGFVRRSGFPLTEKALAKGLQQRFSRPETEPTVTAGEQEEVRRELTRAAETRREKFGPRQAAITKAYLYVTSKSNLFIREIAELVAAGFRAAGFEAQLLVDRYPAEETPGDTIQIVVTPHEFFNLFLIPALPPEEVRRLTRNLFLLGTEQPDSDWFHSNLVMAPHALAILDINSLGVAGYRAHGLRSFHLPLGYHPMLERGEKPSSFERDLDVCLLASLTERREKFLTEEADFFAAHQCHLRLVPLEFAKTETTRSYLADEARNALLQRAKILLNVHYSDLRYFEWHRMLVGLANGCCIVTEACEGFAPLVPGKHFVMVEKEELVGTCAYYLEHSAEREAIARAGRDFIREHLTQAASCAECISQIMRGVEGSLGRNSRAESAPRAPTASGALRQALARDWHLLFHPEPPLPRPDPEAEARIIATIRQHRQGYAGRFAQQEEAAREGGSILELIDNDAFHRAETPAISIVITLFNYERYICECLRSVEQAEIETIPGGIEILIVNDASTDGSLERAKKGQRNSVLPIRIVNKKFNTGLADARNQGIRLARSPYAFIMDADNLIYPRALTVLHEAIRKSQAAAAYTILCRFRGEQSHHRGLLSVFDWDPGMLVEAPYIDAMALFDRRELLELGGYDNGLYQVGWFGWEDYELWLRMAGAHLPVQFVPNVLCLYRQHESSMSNTTSLFEVDLVRHLIPRYQSLLDEHPGKKKVFSVERTRLRTND